MSDREAALEAMIDGASTILGIDVRPEWRAAVTSNLDVSLAFAEKVRAFELPEDTEPAALFDAFAEQQGDP